MWQRLCTTKDSQLLPLRVGLTALKKKKKKRNSRQERKRGLSEVVGPKDRQAAVGVKGLCLFSQPQDTPQVVSPLWSSEVK